MASATNGGLPARLESVRLRLAAGPRYPWWVLWVVLSGLLATNLLFTVFVVALPKVAGGLHTSVATVTWVVTGPMLAYGVVAPLAGKASDLWGHRRLYLLGIGAELLVAIASATAPNVGLLIVARTLGGLVGASIGAASMALVLSVFTRDERVKALGWWSLVGAGGPVIGVAVGGPIIQYIGWRWIFVLQVPLLALAALAAMAVLPERAAGRNRPPRGQLHLDVAGAVTITLGVGSLLFGLNRGPEFGWTSPYVVGAFAVGLVALAAFVRAERRAAEPVFPLVYLSKRNFVFPIIAQTCSNFAYIGAFFLAPLLLEEVFGYAHDQSAVGFLTLPRPLTFSLIAPAAGYVAVRVGERTAAVVGMASIVASMGAFAFTSHSTGLALVEVALVLAGVGAGVSGPSLASSVANEFAPEHLGTASASQQLMNQLGSVTGIQVMQTVQAAADRGHHGAGALLGSFHLSYVVGGVVALGGLAAAAMLRSAVRTPAAVHLEAAMDATEQPPVVADFSGSAAPSEAAV